MLPEYLRVSVDAIDRRHEEFYTLFEQLRASTERDFITCFETLIAHTRSHFAEEEADMQRCGYPNRIEHTLEHMKALDEMDYFLGKAKGGRAVFARAYCAERLGDWFRNHLLNMDSDLARVILLHSPMEGTVTPSARPRA